MIKKIFTIYPIETVVAAVALALGSGMAWWIYINNRTINFSVDAVAHLNFARLMSDSMTAGLSQIGYWPPLLHIFMAPFAAIDLLYRSALAGAALLMPITAAAAVALYRLCFEMTGKRMLSVIAPLIFLSNPFILFYASVPMMEALFQAMLIIAVYFFGRWLKSDSLRDLVLAGGFTALTGMARFEGLILLPLMGFLVTAELIRKKQRYAKIEAAFIIFGILAATGLIFIMVYDWVYGGHPLLFIGGGNSQSGVVSQTPSGPPHTGSVVLSLQYLLYASFHLLGKFLVLASLAAGVLGIILSRRTFHALIILSLLFAPFLAIAFALYRGSPPMQVPELPPGGFFNERYALGWVGFIAAAPVLFGSALQERLRSWLSGRYAPVAAVFFVGTAFLLLGTAHAYTAVKADELHYFHPNPLAGEKLLQKDQISSYLESHYDFGKILVSRFNGEYVIQGSDLPLSTYLHEGNYRFYQQTLSEPWLYARWVVMAKSANRVGLIGGSRLVSVEDRWANNPVFLRFYEPVASWNELTLYKLREEALYAWLEERKPYDLSSIPSLNAHITNWYPEKIHGEIFPKQTL